MYLVAPIENVTRFGHANDNGKSSRHCDGVRRPRSSTVPCHRRTEAERIPTNSSAPFALFDVTVCCVIHVPLNADGESAFANTFPALSASLLLGLFLRKCVCCSHNLGGFQDSEDDVVGLD